MTGYPPPKWGRGCRSIPFLMAPRAPAEPHPRLFPLPTRSQATEDGRAEGPPAPTTSSVRDAYGEWIAGLAKWEAFITLTYDPKRHPWCPSDYEVAKHVAWWFKTVEGSSYSQLRCVGAIELHASGWPHIHSLLGWKVGAWSTTPLLAHKDSLFRPWFTEHGYARVDSVRDDQTAARYVSKYLVKTLGAASSPGLIVLPDPIGRWRPPLGVDTSWS